MARAASERIAVLGGGPAGMATAFELTATSALRERFEVTVYTLGHRLGGKGASGRNAARGQRIEEHGLHVWFGFYENAFSLIQRCYAELDRPAGAALATWRDAFKPCERVVGVERFDGRLVAHEVRMPTNELTPGDGILFDYWDVVAQGLRSLEQRWHAHAAQHAGPDVAIPRPRLRALAAHVAGDVDQMAHRGAADLLSLARRIGERHRGAHPGQDTWHEAEEIVAHLLELARDWAWRHVVEPRLADDRLRLDFMVLDFATAVLTGIARDHLHDRGFASVNGEELRDWLLRHGASELTAAEAPFVRAIYDAAFCYLDGDLSRPNIAAGKGLQDFIRTSLLYKGSVFWKMQAGMGDTVFAPLYEVLRARGVRFAFFHAATRLRAGRGGSSVEAIEVVPQVAIRGGREYEPLVGVGGLPCWPSEPLWDQLEVDEALAGVSFENELNPLGCEPLTLRRGSDFDRVVLAIPVGAQTGSLCEELRIAPAYARMLDASRTVMTQAFQLWLTRPPEQAGAPFDRDMVLVSSPAACGMPQLVAREQWPPEAGVADIAYFCEVLADADGPTQQAADAAVRRHALDLLDGEVLALWRGARRDGGFDWDLLCDESGGSGAKRFDAQYWRANFSPAERYVLTPAGSVEHRLAPGDSGFSNLVLAGDWTHNGIDGGSVEAAVTSGMLASQAITGSPAAVRGVAAWLESDRVAAP